MPDDRFTDFERRDGIEPEGGEWHIPALAELAEILEAQAANPFRPDAPAAAPEDNPNG